MRNLSTLFVAFLLITPVGACAQQSAQKVTDSALMMQLFGNYDSTNGWSIWQPVSVPKEYESYFEGGRGRTSIEFDQTVPVASKRKRFVVLSTVADGGGLQGCHACAVLLSAMVFHDEALQPQIREDFLMAYGQTGEAPKILLQRLGREEVALEFTQDYCMGGTCEGSLFLFGQVRGRLHQILALRSDNDSSDLNICSHPSKEDEADCKADPPYCFGKTDTSDADFRENCTSWTGSLTIAAPQREHGWSDLVFTQYVKATRPGAFARKDYRTRFRFRGDAYKPLEPVPDGPSIDINYYKP